MRSRINLVVLVISLVYCPSILAGQVIGHITDPCDYLISDYTDIIESWVEKDGMDLTFVMMMRGTIPSAPDLNDFNDTLTYIWFVNADNDYKTGQNPGGGVGTEFNIRAVISQNPNFAGVYVDVVGSIVCSECGGSGIVDVNDNVIYATIDRSQIGAVRRLLWRSDAWGDIDGSVSGNGITPASGMARVCRYGVLFNPYSQYSQAGYNYIYAYLETDPNNAVISLSNENVGQHNIFLSDMEKYPDQDSWQILGQNTSHAGPYNLRTFCRLDVNDSDPCAYGYGGSQSIFEREFVLDGNEGETGMVPNGVFFLRWSHDYHIFASDAVGQANAFSFGRVSINQIDPWEQKAYLSHQETACNSDISYKYGEMIDLAGLGLEFGEIYQLSAFLADNVYVNQASDYAEAVGDSSLLMNIDAAIPMGDIDGDWDVDLFDFALFAGSWLEQW